MRVPILKNGSLVVMDDFLANEKEISSDLLEIEYIGEGTTIDLDIALKDFVSLERAKDKDRIHKLDSSFAIKLHQQLNISRFVAAQNEFWHFLTIIYGIEYTRKRWGDDDGKIKDKARVLGKWERNALGRLWWWAELTHLEGDYTLTKAGTGNQSFMLAITDNLSGGNNKLVRELISQVFPNGNQRLFEKQIVSHLFPKLNSLLVTLNIDSLSTEEIQVFVKNLIESADRQ